MLHLPRADLLRIAVNSIPGCYHRLKRHFAGVLPEIIIDLLNRVRYRLFFDMSLLLSDPRKYPS